MNAPLPASLSQAHAVAEAVSQACGRIAPSWPLDEWVAVNPYWGWRDLPFEQAAGWLGLLGGSPLTAQRGVLRAEWAAGRLREEHLQAASEHGVGRTTAAEMRAALQLEPPTLSRLPLLSDLCRAADAGCGRSWNEWVIHQIGQHCAAYFDTEQARWQPDRTGGLYPSWRRQLAHDRSLPWAGPRAVAVQRILALPEEPLALIADSLAALGLPDESRAAYLTALLMNVNGWAGWCARLQWQARQQGQDDDHLVHLLAIRLAWDRLLAAGEGDTWVWAARWTHVAEQAASLGARLRVELALQHALELAYQQPLSKALSRPVRKPAPRSAWLQAVFCIDVRSEVYRRALEAEDDAVHTRGFAGFFGLPIAFRPLGGFSPRPQLPALLAPALTVTESAGDDAGSVSLGQWLARRRQRRLEAGRRWSEWRTQPGSAFSFVETWGLAYAGKLLRGSLPGTQPPAAAHRTGLGRDAARLRPQWPLAADQIEGTAGQVLGVLRAMGLAEVDSPLVLLAGHGGSCTNNPHAAGLDCGACGGQSGEVNARVLAGLLNDPALRDALARQGARIAAGTHFLPAVHDTTTDELHLHDLDQVPEALSPQLDRLQNLLARASDRARAERAAGLGLEALAEQPASLKQALQRRANDWAQLRPEWGLAGNASLIAAPRQRTRGLTLQGRAFLHEYDHRLDPGHAVLEQIITAPMIVANWINLQYHGACVDPRRHGGGNKLLHNVVGGHLGVFEGNGGDLRTGLPWQSVHDGREWRHLPLRLSVYLEAPREAIEAILARHELPRQLVSHGWLHLLRIDPETGQVETWTRSGWLATTGPCLDRQSRLEHLAGDPA